MARNKNCDQVWDIFQQFANVLISPHWSAYVLDDQYTNLINGVGERRKLLAFAHLKPSLLDGFASATIMGACFQAVGAVSAMVGSMGVQFRPHKAITKGLRYTKHSNGHLLTILYATEEDWSKNFRDKTLTDGVTVQDRVVQRVAETFADVRIRVDGQQGHAGRHLQGARQPAAELAVWTEPLPAPPSCGHPVRTESTSSTLLIPRRAWLRFAGGQASGLLASLLSGSHAYLAAKSR